MPSAPTTPVPILMRPPSFHPGTVEWTPGTEPRFVVINPMHIINLQDKSRSFSVRAVQKIKAISEKWFTHVLLLLFLVTYAVLGALLFQWLEQEKENSEKRSVQMTRDLAIDRLWRLAKDESVTEYDWRDMAKRDLMSYESQIQVLLESRAVPDSETRAWTFWGALVYCGAIFTTIGYGNTYPATTAGQAVTIVYAFFGIPFLLIVLADLGKLFTRWIKALFYYVKLFCQAGKLRKARKLGRRATAIPAQYMSAAWNKLPNMTSPGRSRKRGSMDLTDDKRRNVESGNSSIKFSDDEKSNRDASEEGSEILSQNHVGSDISEGKSKKNRSREEEEEAGDATVLPAASPDEVDDEFNLPVSLAVVVLVTYMMLGALLFTLWDEWTFFESFYFVFISMSTIGFGDYVPGRDIIMVATFIYLLFGLALTSMCINIVQEKLSTSFEMAKLKLGTTIGLDANMFMPPPEEVSPDRSDTLDSQKTKSSLKSRRGSKIPPVKSPDTDTQDDEDDKRKSGGSDSDKSPQQFENGTIKKRPDTLGVPTTTH